LQTTSGEAGLHLRLYRALRIGGLVRGGSPRNSEHSARYDGTSGACFSHELH
jgi:hypothetical protein